MGEEGKVGEVEGKKEEKACHVCVCVCVCVCACAIFATTPSSALFPLFVNG